MIPTKFICNFFIDDLWMCSSMAKQVTDAERVYEEERKLYSVLYADTQQVFEKRKPGRPRKGIKKPRRSALPEYQIFVRNQVKLGNTLTEAAQLWTQQKKSDHRD